MGYPSRFSKEFLIRIGWRGEAVKLVSPCQRSCLLHNKILSRICNSLYWFIQKIATIGEDVAHAPASLSRVRPFPSSSPLPPSQERDAFYDRRRHDDIHTSCIPSCVTILFLTSDAIPIGPGLFSDWSCLLFMQNLA